MIADKAKLLLVILLLLFTCLVGHAQDSLNISRVGYIPITEDLWGKALMVGNYAYLPTLGACIRIVDLSNMDDPREVMTLTVPGSGYPKLMLDQHDVLYVQLYRNRFEWYDVSNPAEPVFLGFMTTPEGLEGMTCDEDILVLTGHAPESLYDGWMQVYSLYNPHLPELVYDGEVSEALSCPILHDSYLYVTGNFSLRTFDMRNPEEPVECSSLYLPCESLANIYLFNDYLHITYLASRYYRYKRVIDLSDPAFPVDLGNLRLNNQPVAFHDQVVIGDTLLVLPDLKKLVATDPCNTTVVWESQNPNPGYNLECITTHPESNRFIVNNANRLTCFEADEDRFRSLLGNTLTLMNSMAAGDSLLVASRNEVVYVYNVSDPSCPVASDTFSVLNDFCPNVMHMKNGAVYMSLLREGYGDEGAYYTRALGAYDLTYPTGVCLLYYQDEILSYMSMNEDCFPMSSSDSRLFYIPPTVIMSLDISNPYRPRDIATTPVSDNELRYMLNSGAANDTVLYVTTCVHWREQPPMGYFQGYSFPESGEVELLFEIPYNDVYDNRLYVRNNLLYMECLTVDSDEMEVQLYDISDPIVPRYLTTFTSWFPRENQAKLILDGDYAFVADMVEGVSIYYFDTNTSFVKIGHSDMWGPAVQMEVDDDLIYIKNRHRIGIYNISNALAVSEPKHQATSEFLPTRVALDAPWPNPFNSSTSISWTLPQQEHVSLVVYDILGRRVRTLCNEVRTAGSHRIHWDGSSEANRLVSSGTYFLRLETESGTMTRSIHLVK